MMGRGQNQQAPTTITPSLFTMAPQPSAPIATWETRLYSGLRMACVPHEVRATLASALGTLGVEAEYFLLLLASFPGDARPSHARGEVFLSQLEAAGRRLYHSANSLEIATQGYLTALESGYPELRSQDDGSEPWWPAPLEPEIEGESIELRMRRCGFAYRHVVEVYLGTNLTAIANQLALVLVALSNLPPAGTLPAASLYQGLYELSSTFQGHIIPHHIGDRDPHSPGLLTSISRLRRLSADEDTSLQSDLLWAEAQLKLVQEFLKASNISSAQRQWATTAAAEWRETLQLLGSLRPSGR
ncbi:MAG: hypothetical protein ACLQUY_14115 [Ktedonobacterales bacterium]